VLDAAAEVFHEHGLGAGLEDVARRAGVGVATVYRRFPTRDALLETLLSDLLQVYLDEAERARALPTARASRRSCGRSPRSRRHRAAAPCGCGARRRGAAARAAARADGRADHDAQQHGTCRDGITVEDLVGVLVALRGVRETPTSTGGLDWRRHLELCLAGLRP
jgi:AcrR family transcriptional regulator